MSESIVQLNGQVINCRSEKSRNELMDGRALKLTQRLGTSATNNE